MRNKKESKCLFMAVISIVGIGLIMSQSVISGQVQDNKIVLEETFEWSDDFTEVEKWSARPTWVGNPSATAKVTTTAGIAGFQIDESSKGMKWLRNLPNIWLEEQRFLIVRYRAKNVNTTSSDYFLYLDDGRGSPPWCSPIRLMDVKADGEWHAVAVDVLPMVKKVSLRAMAVQVQATETGKTLVEIDYVKFADRVPEGIEELKIGSFSPEPDVNISVSESVWTAQPSWLSNPTQQQEVVQEKEWVTFRTNESERGMKWSWDLPEPIELVGHRYILFRYRAKNIKPGGDYTLCVLGKPAAEGGLSYISVVPPGAILSDGRWHNLMVDAMSPANVIPKVMGLTVQVQSTAVPEAELSIAQIKLVNQFVPSPLADFLDVKESADFSNFKSVDISKICNSNLEAFFKRLRIMGVPKKDVTVSKIPFKLVQGTEDCVASSLRNKQELRIPVDVKTDEIFLFITAIYSGAEEPVYTRGLSAKGVNEKLLAIRGVDRFLLKLIYDDGSVEECMPLCITTKNYEVVNGPQVLCAFADKSKQLKEVVLCDKTEQGGFAVSSISCRTQGNRAFAGFSEEIEPLRLAPKKGVPEDIIQNRLSGLVGLKINGKDASLIDWKKINDKKIIYNFDNKVNCELQILDAKNQETRLTINMENSTNGELKIVLFAPQIEAFKLGNKIEDNYYLYPRSGTAFNNVPASFRERFCGAFPVQFMQVFNPREGCGIYLRTEDRNGIPRYYTLKKSDKDMTLAVEYQEVTLAPGEKFKALDTYIGMTGGDWNEGLHAYQNWVKTWYPKLSPEKQWFREVFNFRQRFLWFLDSLYDTTNEKFVLQKAVDEAVKEFGGMDYLHIFDWGNCGQYGRIYGRTGDYPPYTMWKGGLEAFARAIKEIQDQGIPVGLYLEGYLLSQKGLLGQKYGKEWHLIGKDGKGRMWPESTEQFVCPYLPAWREVLASTYGARVKELNVNGMYLDQFGFADYGKDCWSKEHGHPVPSFSAVSERDCTQMVRERIDSVKKGAALYSEEIPCDLASIHQDGSFTYTMRRAMTTSTMVPINIFRFAIPQFKTIEILVCDKPTGSWAEGVKWIFFNGEAMWIEGTLEWFGENVRSTIRKCYGILRQHKDAFTSLEPEPLIPTEMGGIFANMFPAQGKTVYTFYNSRHRTVKGEVLKIKHKPNAKYFDAWNERTLVSRQEGEFDIISLEIEPKGVGCVVCEK